MKHTELPLEMYRGPELFGQTHIVLHCGGQIVAAVDDEEQAAFIVHAVNNHYKLVEALRDCVRIMEIDLSGLDFIQPELRKAKAALASATMENKDV